MSMEQSAPSAVPVIRLSRVSKRFGENQVLRDVELEVSPRALAGLVGVNGAGKTTLIKCLLDFCHADAGRIEIFGLKHTLPHSRRRVAFLPERFTPPYYLTGREFIRAMQSMCRRGYDEARALAAFHDLDLAPETLGKPVGTLSKGMTQKLGLAACLVTERDFYLLDEPMSGLDPKARACVKNIFRRLHEQGKTLLFTSHSLADIEEICDHMLVLHRGSIAFSGAPRELCERFDESTLEGAFLRCTESND